jgi:hypothetical protein
MILTFKTDGGGVRSISTLLIVKVLMEICGDFELAQDPLATSSYHPIPYPDQKQGSSDQRSSRYLPAHYFDYIGKNLCYPSQILYSAPANASKLGPVLEGEHSSGSLLFRVILIPKTSLLAVMLSRLRMNVDDCISQYLRISDLVFGHPRVILPLFFQPKYKASRLRNAIQDLVTPVQNKGQSSERHPDEAVFQSNPERAKT